VQFTACPAFDALDMPCGRNLPGGESIQHSYHGNQYTSGDYQYRLHLYRVLVSLVHKCYSWDSANGVTCPGFSGQS
jgi:hypothetical protein